MEFTGRSNIATAKRCARLTARVRQGVADRTGGFTGKGGRDPNRDPNGAAQRGRPRFALVERVGQSPLGGVTFLT